MWQPDMQKMCACGLCVVNVYVRHSWFAWYTYVCVWVFAFALASCTFCVECFASERSALELLVLGSAFAVTFHKQKLQKHKSTRTPVDLIHLASGSVDSTTLFSPFTSHPTSKQ